MKNRRQIFDRFNTVVMANKLLNRKKKISQVESQSQTRAQTDSPAPAG
jgi:hypothetical protein